MLYNPARRDSSLDLALIWSATLLCALGLVMVYSASIAMAEAERFTGFRPGYFLVRHGAYRRVKGSAHQKAPAQAPVAVAAPAAGDTAAPADDTDGTAE